MTNGRSNHGCGWVWTKQGLELVVAGGWAMSDSEIYSFKTDTWRPGPDLPQVFELCKKIELQYKLML